MRKIALFFATLAMATVLASPAGASSASRLHLLTVGGCQYRSNIDNGSVDQWCTTMAFPAEAQPGDVFNVTVKAYAKVAESQNATVSFYGLGAAGLTLVGNGDTSAAQTGNSFAYTDYYYGGATNGDGYANGKGDNYSFRVADDQAPGTYSIVAKVTITDDGYGGYEYPSSAWEYLTYTIPAPVITPEMFVNNTQNINGCASQPVLRSDGTWGTFVTLDRNYLEKMMYQGVSFTPAFFYIGYGATCDVLPGYHSIGMVSSDGTVNTADPTANINPGFAKN